MSGSVFLSLPVIFGFVLVGAPARVAGPSFTIPPTKASFDVDNQPVTVVASGAISQSATARDVFDVKLNVELSDLGDHLTQILKDQLDRDDRCGERLSVQHATLNVAAPAAILTAQIHYERWACAKGFGKQVVKRLVGGDGTVQVKLTPSVEAPNTLRLDPEVGEIQADGSLGEVLRSGSMAELVREKITVSMVKAVRKATDLQSMLPPALEQIVAVRSVEFASSSGGALAVVVSGEVRLPADQMKALVDQMQSR